MKKPSDRIHPTCSYREKQNRNPMRKNPQTHGPVSLSQAAGPSGRLQTPDGRIQEMSRAALALILLLAASPALAEEKPACQPGQSAREEDPATGVVVRKTRL